MSEPLPKTKATEGHGSRSDGGGRARFSPYASYSRAEWAKLRDDVSITLSQADLDRVSGVTERLSESEVVEVYLPLARLLNLHVGAIQKLHKQRDAFLGRADGVVPFVIGLAGSVAVGKSTTARALQALLARFPEHPRVDLVTTDGFLWPNKVLDERGLMNRKGFPESYDFGRLLRFLADVKSGRDRVTAPVYDHISYDVIGGEGIDVERPDILIVEGLNVLQPSRLPKDGSTIPYISDFFDFSIYIDADQQLIQRWYVARFLRLRETAFRDPKAYFHRYAALSDAAAEARALELWRSINLVNLTENIVPTRQRADLILRKGEHHRVAEVQLRKL